MADDEGLRERVQQAIHEHLAAEGGGMVQSFYLILDYLDSEGEPSWAYVNAEGQRMHTTLGLLRWAEGCAEYEQRRYLDDNDGGDPL